MTKLLKWIGIVVGVVVVLVVGAAVTIPMFISVDTYKGEIISQVKSNTGRDLQINGPVKLSVLPHLAIEASQVSFANAPGGQSKAMMTLGKLSLELELFPLLRGTVAVDRFVLEDPTIALEVDKQGKANWEFTPAGAATATPAAPKPAQASAPAASGGSSWISQLRLGEIGLKNGTVSYLDQKTGQRTVIDKINASLVLPDLNAPLKADGSLQYNGQVINLKLALEKANGFASKEGTGVQASVTSDIMSFDFKGKGAAMPASASGTIDLKVPSLRKLAAWGGSPMPKGEGFGPFAIAGKLELAGSEIKFNDAQLTFDAIKGKGQLVLNTGGAKPDVKGSLELASLNVNPYLPPESAGAAPAAAASGGWSNDPIDVSDLKLVNADFQFTASAIQLRKIKIDKGSVTLKLKDGHLTSELT